MSYYGLIHGTFLHPDALPRKFFYPLDACSHCGRDDWLIKCGCCNYTVRVCCLGFALSQLSQQALDFPPLTNLCGICGGGVERHRRDRTLIFQSPVREPRTHHQWFQLRLRQQGRLSRAVRSYRMLMVATKKAQSRTRRFLRRDAA